MSLNIRAVYTGQCMCCLLFSSFINTGVLEWFNIFDQILETNCRSVFCLARLFFVVDGK